MRVAAIDVGTNTVRLLVAEPSEHDLVAVEKARVITRLGKGVDGARRLDPEASRRTLAVLEGFVARAHALGSERIRVAGTSVLRDAVDRKDFATAVEHATGVKLEILDGDEEGGLAFAGATWGLPEEDYVVCDIGGGSTELVRGDKGNVRAVSLDVGSVRLTERLFSSSPPSSAETAAAWSSVEDSLSEADSLGMTGGERLVGVAGTITTLAAVLLGLEAYDSEAVHHSSLSLEDIRQWSERLLQMTSGEIVALGTVEPGRADVISAGALILRGVMERWGWREVLVSERDILEGLALDLAGATQGATKKRRGQNR